MRISAISAVCRATSDAIEAISWEEPSTRRIQSIDPHEIVRTSAFERTMGKSEDPAYRRMRVLEVIYAPGVPSPRFVRLRSRSGDE